MARRSHAMPADDSQVDLTPMLDVVFIMLIFFIVTASFVKDQVIDTRTPDAITESEPTEQPPIVVSVDANNGVWLEGRQVDVRALRANFARLHAEVPDVALIVQAHYRSNTATDVAIADAARQAAIGQILLKPVDGTI